MRSRLLVPALAALLLACGDGAPEVPQGGRIYRVVDPFDRPIEGARVVLYRLHPLGLDATEIARAVSDGEGRIALPAAGEGTVVSAVADGFGAEVFPIEEAREGIALSPGGPVRGVVVDLAGKPLAGARVVSPTRPPFALETRAAADGSFLLDPLADDAWIRAEAEGYAPLDLSLSLYPLEGRDVAFPLVPEKRVRGRVLDSTGSIVPGAVVELDQEVLSRVVTDEEGRFTMTGVLPDWEVLLTPRAEGYVGTTVTALAGETGVYLPLYRPAEIRGRVIDGRTGDPVESFTVTSRDAEPVGPSGFRIAGLPPGETRVEVQSGSLEGEVTLELREGEVRRDVAIPLFPPRWSAPDDYRPAYPVRIEVAYEGSGEPAAGVLVRPESGKQSARTGADGTVTVRVPPGKHRFHLGGHLEAHSPAEVAVEVPDESGARATVTRNPECRIELTGGTAREGSKLWIRCGGELKEVKFGGRTIPFPCSRDAPVDVYVRARWYREAFVRDDVILADGIIEIPLARGPDLRGRCLGSGGHPLAKVVVEVEEDPMNLRMETAGDGKFLVGPLPEGTVHVMIYARNVRARRLTLPVTEDGVDLGDVDLLPPAEIAVLVVDGNHLPVGGASVETSILVAAKGVTDAEGRLTLPGTEESDELRVRAAGFLDAWREVHIPEGEDRVEVVVRLARPAGRILLVTDAEGRLAHVSIPERDDVEVRSGGPGVIVVTGIPPGPFEMEIEDREGRRTVYRTVVREGEVRTETVVLE